MTTPLGNFAAGFAGSVTLVLDWLVIHFKLLSSLSGIWRKIVPAKFAWRIGCSPKSDPQRNKVYRMENEAIGARSYQNLSRTRIGQLVRSISQNYRVPCPRLVWKNLGRWAAEWTEPGEIALNTRKNTARDVLTITHEMAHHVHFHLGGEATRGQESHGPEFMAVHMSILDTCRVVPVVGMRAICQQYRIRFADPGTRSSLGKLRRIARGFNSKS